VTSEQIACESSGDFHVIEAADDPALWDDYVASNPASTICHLAGWKQIMSDVLGHEPLYMMAVDEQGIWRGVLPLVRVRSFLGHYLISVPFLNDGGPLGDAAARQALAEFAVAEARRSGASLVELRSRDDLTAPVSASNRKISVHLALPASNEELWQKTFRAKLRSQIRRPLKEGMIARTGPAELGSFYQVFSRNMRDLGTPVLPRRFFERMAAIFGSHVVFTTVYTKEGDPAAAACSLLWRSEMEVTWASSVRELNHLSPNMLLYSRLIETAIDAGGTVFNFGRCSPNSSPHRFKLQWGGHDVPLPWPSWTREATAGVPSQDRPIFRVATTVWRHLPLTVANRLGPGLARLLP
jgi:serine/alanine adding enzyme